MGEDLSVWIFSYVGLLASVVVHKKVFADG